MSENLGDMTLQELMQEFANRVGAIHEVGARVVEFEPFVRFRCVMDDLHRKAHLVSAAQVAP